jgi:hypothetical protein
MGITAQGPQCIGDLYTYIRLFQEEISLMLSASLSHDPLTIHVSRPYMAVGTTITLHYFNYDSERAYLSCLT